VCSYSRLHRTRRLFVLFFFSLVFDHFTHFLSLTGAATFIYMFLWMRSGEAASRRIREA
jgi:hypothetical protein